MAPEVERCPLKLMPQDNKNKDALAYTTAVVRSFGNNVLYGTAAGSGTSPSLQWNGLSHYKVLFAVAVACR